MIETRESADHLLQCVHDLAYQQDLRELEGYRDSVRYFVEREAPSLFWRFYLEQMVLRSLEMIAGFEQLGQGHLASALRAWMRETLDGFTQGPAPTPPAG